MGILNQMGSMVGQAFAPPATAGGTAGAATTWGTLSTGLNVGGAVLSGVGGYEQAQYQAKLAGRNAEAAAAAGQFAESASKMKYGALEAGQKTSAAAGGVDVGSGAVKATIDSTKEIGALDATMIHYNAMRESMGLAAQSAVDKSAGRGAVVGGLLKAGTSFLSGANSLSDKWLDFGRVGIKAGA